MSVDDLVDSITPYTLRPVYLHGYVVAFVPLYASVLYVWLAVLGYEAYFELGCIGIVAVALLQILTLLFCHWFVSIRCLLTAKRLSDATQASVVCVCPTPNNGSAEIVPLLRRRRAVDGGMQLSFEFQKVTYVYEMAERRQFRAVDYPINDGMRHYQESKGLDTDDALAHARERFGENKMEMVIPAFLELFQERATAPFFVFQVFCVGLWCLDEMWYYSLFTLGMLVMFEATLVKQQLKNMADIRNMGNKPYLLKVYRKKRWESVKSDALLAGDIVSIGRSHEEHSVPCDMLLLRGPCIVDESMLTGESVPQMKEPIESLEKDRCLDIDTDGRLHVVFGGTRVVQNTPPAKTEPGLKAPDSGCLAYVLRTGFNTSQGRLLRTIMFGVKRVTANNLETFAFIIFLLIFAVSASVYVWVKGTEDESRNKYKLFLECTLILTSVVPPELPIELSLAVNNSLLALQKLGVFCTEPFRIPFAGRVDVCCFDKTGTLTKDQLVVEGVAGIDGTSASSGGEPLVLPLSKAPPDAIQVMACCHSLVKLDDDLVGDPLEKACLTSIEWTLTKNDAVMPKKGGGNLPLKIFHRHHFSSALKRMAVVAGYMLPGTSDTHYIAAVKGAPETLRAMFAAVPVDYDAIYQQLTRQGARVLAIGKKPLGMLTHQQVRELKREELESALDFCGFVVISCPLKDDSKEVIRDIVGASHRVVMITGDNPLTACHVAKVLRFSKKSKALVLDTRKDEDGGSEWRSVDDSIVLPRSVPNLKSFINQYDLCITGDAFAQLLEEEPKFLRKIIKHIVVFARMSPKQKERVVTELKSLGVATLMCGDGTNDVGALKHADVGVALLSHPAESKKSSSSSQTADSPGSPEKNGPTPSSSATNSLADARERLKNRGIHPNRSRQDATVNRGAQKSSAQRKMEQMLKDMEEEQEAQVVKLGDASIAAPFTSKYSSIESICHVIKQGRCTLVTTLQMFKILALNALVLAYSQSVLYLDGIKFSDSQATIQGLLLAACFLFISRSKPLKVLAKQRPMVNIFNVYTLFTVTLQFAVHFVCLMFLVRQAHERSPPKESKFVNLSEEFKPSLLNTTVYIMSVALQVSTFAVNYRGRPFMESLWENKAMLYSILFSGGSIFALAAGLLPELSEKFELVPLPEDFRNIVLAVLAADLGCCYVIDRILNFVFGDIRIRNVS